MYENVCYKSPFLKEVILRLDFGASAEQFARALPQKVATAALQRFPLSEPKQGRMQEVKIEGANVLTRTDDFVHWIYHGKNREKTLTITPQYFVVSNRSYESFEAFNDDFVHVSKTVFAAIKDLSISRLGLRYINLIETEGEDPLAWADYVNEEMLGIIDMHKDTNALSRAFHIIEFNYDGQQVKFQFGIANPDHPAPIRRRQFVLDIDSFVAGALLADDVARHLHAAHERIQALFEESITNKTRQLMRPADA